MGAAGALNGAAPLRRSAETRRRLLATGACLPAAWWPWRALAQTRAGASLPLVAFVYNSVPLSDLAGPEPAFPEARAFLQALRRLGWVDGRNVTMRFVSAEGRPERLPSLMEQLVASQPAVILANGEAANVAKRATRTIPVIGLIDDARADDFIDSLSHPRGNVTAITTELGSLTPKRLEFLKAIAPRIGRVAILNSPGIAGADTAFGRTEASARALALTLVWIDVEQPEGIEAALDRALAEQVDAIVVEDTRPNYLRGQAIIEFALRNRLPTAFAFHEFVEAGGLLAYQADPEERMRRAASYADRILHGAKPADLPVDQPAAFSLVVNMRTARTLGLSIPPALQLRITRTLE